MENILESGTYFDETNFPIVRVVFGKAIKNREEFDEFKNNWMKLYLREKDFYLIFDTSEIKKLPISYIYDLAKFIKKLKQLEKQYLVATIILIKSDFVKKLYELLLKLQKPISLVYLVKTEEDVSIICNKLKLKEKVIGYKEYHP